MSTGRTIAAAGRRVSCEPVGRDMRPKMLIERDLEHIYRRLILPASVRQNLLQLATDDISADVGLLMKRRFSFETQLESVNRKERQVSQLFIEGVLSHDAYDLSLRQLRKDT